MMNEHGLYGNSESINKMRETLDRVEAEMLQYRVEESLLQELMEVGYWANEILQARIAYEERQTLLGLIQRVKYLQMLYLENTLDLRAVQLSKELRGLISEEAWRVYLRLDEVRGMEEEYFHGKALYPDYNLDLVVAEQELKARLSTLKLRTY